MFMNTYGKSLPQMTLFWIVHYRYQAHTFKVAKRLQVWTLLNIIIYSLSYTLRQNYQMQHGRHFYTDTPPSTPYRYYNVVAVATGRLSATSEKLTHVRSFQLHTEIVHFHMG